MSARATLTPAHREGLLRLLLGGARDGRVDLGTRVVPNWAAIDGFLLDAGIAPEELAALTRRDIEAIRTRLSAGPTRRERVEALLERLDDSGLASVVLVVAIILALAWLVHSLLAPVRAAPQDPGPVPSEAAGLLMMLVPVGSAVAFMACATRGRVDPADDEAFGDTTGFGERDR